MLYVSPSKVASYFYHECERHLYYYSLPKKERNKLGIASDIFEQQFVNQTILTAGIKWEEKVVKVYLKDDVKIADKKEGISLCNRYLEVDEVIQELRNPSKKFIYQPTFVIPESFYKKYNIDQTKSTFSSC
jgi:DNA replication ATP-dependent helicase Dna2